MDERPDVAASSGGHRRAAVLGSPISHSLSPTLHRAAYASLGLDWTYDAFDVTEEQLPGFLDSLDESWIGLSLTMPLKERIIPLLTTIDPVAARVGAVNTALRRAHGWDGANTDIDGIVEALQRAGIDPASATATLLGAGATARSAVAALQRLGISRLTVCARRPEAARTVADLAESLGMECLARDLAPTAGALAVDVVVSSLPGDAARPWADLAPSAMGALLDVSYHPWPSVLAAQWGSAVVASGRDMLLWQAVEQVRLMTGRVPSADAMRAALPA